MTETLNGSEKGTAGNVGIGSLNDNLEVKVIVKSSSQSPDDVQKQMNKSQ